MLTLTLTVEQAQAVVDALEQRPHWMVHELISVIVGQAQAQIAPTQEAPDVDAG